MPAGCPVIEGEVRVVKGFPVSWTTCPTVKLHLNSTLVKGPVEVAVTKEFPVKEVDFILANDIAKGRVNTEPLLICRPGEHQVSGDNGGTKDIVFPVTVVTRSASNSPVSGGIEVELAPLFDEGAAGVTSSDIETEGLVENNSRSGNQNKSPSSAKVKVADENLNWSSLQLIELQKEDNKINNLREDVDLGRPEGDKFFIKDQILFKKSVPILQSVDERVVGHQIVVPPLYRYQILERAHEDPFSGHGGISKTLSRVGRNFYWPSMKKDIVKHCKTGHEC